MMETLDND